jgi:CheY-like chemotaxis protein
MTSNQLPEPLPKYCILCVDDDLIGLGARAALLEEEGYSVTAVSCPLMALEHDVSKFHMAILDFAMPVLNGFQLLLRLRAARASFPIVLLSGMSRELPNDIRSVFSSCLGKGEPIHLLLNTVRSYLTSIPDPPECQVMGRDVHLPHRGHGCALPEFCPYLKQSIAWRRVSPERGASAYKVLNAVCFRLNSITIPVNRRMASIGQQIAVQISGLLQSLQ